MSNVLMHKENGLWVGRWSLFATQGKQPHKRQRTQKNAKKSNDERMKRYLKWKALTNQMISCWTRIGMCSKRTREYYEHVIGIKNCNTTQYPEDPFKWSG